MTRGKLIQRYAQRALRSRSIPSTTPNIVSTEKLRREIDKGLASIERGDVSDFDAETIKREGRRILASR